MALPIATTWNVGKVSDLEESPTRQLGRSERDEGPFQLRIQPERLAPKLLGDPAVY